MSRVMAVYVFVSSRKMFYMFGRQLGDVMADFRRSRFDGWIPTGRGRLRFPPETSGL